MPGKLYILHGEDEYSSREYLDEIKGRLGPRDALDANTTAFEGRSLAFPEFQMTCNTIPFLGDSRLVIVQGLLERFAARSSGGSRRRSSQGEAGDKASGEWDGVGASIQAMPPTTTVVFIGGPLSTKSSLYSQLAPLGEVKEFPGLRSDRLNRWITDRAGQQDGAISPGAARLLANFVGGNLRQLDSEIRKLCVYAGPRPVDEDDVRGLVEDTRQAGIFTLVDAIMEGRRNEAIRTLRQLIEQGAAGPYIITMLARQVRMVLQAKSLAKEGASGSDMARALGTTSDFVLRKTLEQARSFTEVEIIALYRQFLDADLSIKTGAMTEELALETLVVEAAGARR